MDTKIYNEQSMAILIDCLPNSLATLGYPGPPTPDWLIPNIKEFCRKKEEIKTIVYSSYCRHDTIESTSPGYNTSTNIFSKETKLDVLRREWNLVCDGICPSLTHPDLQSDWHRPDQSVLSMFSTTQLLYYCNSINNNINKIYFFGLAWDVCVKHRPTGWMQVNSLNYHNLFHTNKQILSVPNCVGKPFDRRNSMACYRIEYFDHPWQQLENGDWVLSADEWN
jgi:hypothetical protein